MSFYQTKLSQKVDGGCNTKPKFENRMQIDKYRLMQIVHANIDQDKG